MAKTTNNVKKAEWEARCAELELIVQDCAAAFELIPINALEKGQTWFPSEVAIRLLSRAKTSVSAYSASHWHSGSGR